MKSQRKGRIEIRQRGADLETRSRLRVKPKAKCSIFHFVAGEFPVALTICEFQAARANPDLGCPFDTCFPGKAFQKPLYQGRRHLVTHVGQCGSCFGRGPAAGFLVRSTLSRTTTYVSTACNDPGCFPHETNS